MRTALTWRHCRATLDICRSPLHESVLTKFPLIASHAKTGTGWLDLYLHGLHDDSMVVEEQRMV